MGKRRKSGAKGRQPDEYFARGPIELARFGKTMIARSRATPQQFKEMQQRMADMLPQTISEIDTLVEDIAKQISALPPGRLLHRAYWEFSAVALMQGNDALEQSGAIRMLDYVQSVIASVPRASDQFDDVSEDAWNNLQTNIKQLFDKITIQYQPCLTAARRIEDPQLDMELEEFRVRTEGMWMHVRGKRYQPHEKIALAELLTPHSDVLARLFGISAEALAEEFDKILWKLSGGAASSMMALKQLHEDSIPKMDEIFATGDIESADDVMRKLFEDPELAARRKAIMGEVAGLDLFDVGMVTELPESLIDELTWSQGEDNSFFSSGALAGWPLRLWPTMRRPFLRIDGRAMCFEMWGLFDNIYRGLQKVVLSREPEYREHWNRGQKEVSEALPQKYFDKLLTGNTGFSSITYPWRENSGKSKWCECDGLIIYDDHLFVVEVKAGAFTYTSPATDLAAHLTSLRNLIEAPAAQGNRFIEYLESDLEVPIFDGERNELTCIRRQDFRTVTVVALSLDSFTELAARAQHLSKVGVELGTSEVWALSIDDLRVYADIFDNPLIFIHFIEQRMQAVTNDSINLDDEIDHLGLYLAQNNYEQYAREFGGAEQDRIQFTGFRAPIDEFYTALVNNEVPSRPSQEMPSKLREIIDFLAGAKKAGSTMLASFLLDGDGELRQNFADGIDDQLEGNIRLRRQRPFLVAADRPFTVCTWSPLVPRIDGEALEYTRSVVAANGGTARLLIELEYDKSGSLFDVHWQQVSLECLSKEELAKAQSRGEAGKRRRVEMARTRGKIPVNSQCPCGSGKKYKRCCRP